MLFHAVSLFESCLFISLNVWKLVNLTKISPPISNRQKTQKVSQTDQFFTFEWILSKLHLQTQKTSSGHFSFTYKYKCNIQAPFSHLQAQRATSKPLSLTYRQKKQPSCAFPHLQAQKATTMRLSLTCRRRKEPLCAFLSPADAERNL